MKRRYKAGDWFVAPLPSGRAVTGLIARAAASRLFGYLFPGVVPRDGLSDLRAEHALWRGLFNARGIEDHRWRIVATSLRFQRERWPLPRFAVREPFGRRWSERTLHDETLATVTTQPSDEVLCRTLPDARIYEPEHVEALIDASMDGGNSTPLVVVDVHAPLDTTRLRSTPPHARVQSGEALGTRDTAILGGFLATRDDVALRLYGSVDRATLLELVWLTPQLRNLEIDIPLETMALLYPLERLEQLTVRRAEDAELPEPDRFRALRSLSARGTFADRRVFARFPVLSQLVLQTAHWESANPLRDTPRLRDLEFADMPLRDLSALGSLPGLRVLSL
ncbi:MAG: hypothetical protein JO165_03140, partial [Candidatus Eremiobacteraeota bacterium]|nr:hypothetical protein [Candidatus Eremiobacteraeota bacterium]